MANPNAIGGIAYFKIDGQQYALRGNCKYSPGDRERETKVGMDGVHGYTETPAAPFVEVDLTNRPTLDIKKLFALNNTTITLEMENGKQFVLRNAWCVTRPEVDAAEGMFTIRFEGLQGDEVAASA